ncbi:MAG: DUF6876 family protein [Kordia sp.]|uniref:DUF6876 family protein n=1 Tax=Kordia sp. TaxID=1965332 RepID=UPI00385FD4BB
MAKEFKPEELLRELAQFTGTTQWFYHPLFPSFRYTDGVRYLAQTVECYWLLEYIFSNQIIPEIKKQEFQVWKIFVVDDSTTIKVEDGNDNLVKEFKIPFTTFPLSEYTLWFTDNVLLLKSEY